MKAAQSQSVKTEIRSSWLAYMVMAATVFAAPVFVLAQSSDAGTQAPNAQKLPSDLPATSAPADSKKDSKKDKSKDSKDAAAQETQPQAQNIPSPGEDLDPHIRPGSEDDVSAVGNRKIGGRGFGNWYSTDTEIKIGKQYSMEVEKSAHIITDPVISEYVNRIGQNIVKNSDCKVPFTIKVIDTDEINAFALPGGFFYVNSGLILAADNEAELAGVMAHETAHVCAHHAMREMTRANIANIGMIPVMIVAMGSWTGYGIYEAAQLAIPMTFLQFSRNFESEADWLGIQYMYRAGYDPQAFIEFFEKIEALQKHKPGMVAKAFSSHPQTPERIDRSEYEIARYLPSRPEYVVTTSEFDQVKARLARLENKRKLKNGQDSNKPTLRRVDSTNSNSTDGSDTGSDRPTLHRREN
ncbi:MAG: M48 family metallopeptidase [Acidobacteriaceae bacterium]